MAVSLRGLRKGSSYSRQALAELWGYPSLRAIPRGILTPRNDWKVFLFVTGGGFVNEELGTLLYWEGSSDHFADDRICRSPSTGEEIYLFYRDWGETDFTYYGEIELFDCTRKNETASDFIFRLR
jgi:hypothetical protein